MPDPHIRGCSLSPGAAPGKMPGQTKAETGKQAVTPRVIGEDERKDHAIPHFLSQGDHGFTQHSSNASAPLTLTHVERHLDAAIVAFLGTGSDNPQ